MGVNGDDSPYSNATGKRAQSGSASPEPVVRSVRSSYRERRLLDREPAREALRKRLKDGPAGLVVVKGDEGVGKSLLVDKVLDELGRDVRVYRHEALSEVPFDVRTLTDDLADRVQAAQAVAVSAPRGADFYRSSVARLEAALRTSTDEPVVIVIESAENLMRSEGSVVGDLDLDEAFETLTEVEGHRVSVVLVTRREPRSSRDSTWQTAEPQIEVPPLPPQHFNEFLDELDHRLELGLAALPDESRNQFATAVRRNPRTTEFACSLLGTSKGGLDAEDLISGLMGQRRSEIPRWVAERLIRSCDDVERRILEALAAFGTPVTSESLAAVLDKVTPGQLKIGLQRLYIRTIVRETDRLFYLPTSCLRNAVDSALNSGEAGARLLAAVACELRDHRVEPPQTLSDLEVTFAELRALERAGWYAAAYDVIEWIDETLREWHCSAMLLPHREGIAERLVDDHQKMANDNALAHLYTVTGNLAAADAAYGRAIDGARRRDDPSARVQIGANAAGLKRMRGDTEDARRGYLTALDVATRSGSVDVKAQALEGLADCDRRQGRYPDALARAGEVLALRSSDDQGDGPGPFLWSRQIRCGFKLAGWYAELGDLAAAEHHVLAAQRRAQARGDRWLEGAALEAQADVLLAQGRHDDAVATATEAEDHASRVNDAITLMRARTTLCTAYLIREEGPASPHTIERMLRYRRPGHSLIVLALCGLLADQRGNEHEADERFRTLRTEASERLRRDQLDFSARNLLALANCALAPDAAEAVREFRRARSTTTVPTPGIVDRLIWMLRRVGALRGTTAALEPALRTLQALRSGPA